MPLKHNSAEEARNHFRDSFNRVVKDDKWMVALWKVEDGKISLDQITTYGFPIDDYLAAVGHLSLQLFELNKERTTQEPQPLPRAFLPERPPLIRRPSEGSVPEVLQFPGRQQAPPTEPGFSSPKAPPTPQPGESTNEEVKENATD